MVTREIAKGVYGIMMNDWDRRLFDELIPLPEGTSYNAYLIKDEKNILIDTSDPSKSGKFMRVLRDLSEGRIDYIVSNHSEQDHSGCIPDVLKAFPDSKVIASDKGVSLLSKLLSIPEERCKTVGNGEELSIGTRKLRFLHAPWVHWPETMITYDIDDRILFPCDLFGAHLATSTFYASCGENLHSSAKRYYAEIMMPFRNNIRKHLELIEKLDIGIIAPSHGPVYNNPDFIISAYRNWVSDSVKNEVVIPYISMHGSVARMVDCFSEALVKKGIEAKPFNLTVTDVGELAMSFVDAATVVLGAPTVLAGPHPAVFYATYLFKVFRPKTRFISVIGSYGWGGNMLKSITDMLPAGNAEVLTPVIVKGLPGNADFELLESLAETIAQKHKQLDLF